MVIEHEVSQEALVSLLAGNSCLQVKEFYSKASYSGPDLDIQINLFLSKPGIIPERIQMTTLEHSGDPYTLIYVWYRKKV